MNGFARLPIADRAAVIGDAAKEHVQELIFALKKRQLILIAQDAVPAMRSLVCVFHKLWMRRRHRLLMGTMTSRSSLRAETK